MYPGQHMSIEDNIFYAKRNIVDSIWKEANIEGIDITFPATKMLIADGCGILAIPREQINNFETLLLDFYETNKPDKFFSFLTKEAIYGLDRTVQSSQNLKVKCKAATLGSNALKTRSNTVGISKTQNADRTAHTEHIE